MSVSAAKQLHMLRLQSLNERTESGLFQRRLHQEHGGSEQPQPPPSLNTVMNNLPLQPNR